MASPSKGGSSAPVSPPEFREIIVRRDSERPFSFAGVQIAKASKQGAPSIAASGNIETLEAAVYRTRGGKYVTTLSKMVKDPIQEFLRNGFPDEEDVRPKGEYQKAAVHESLDEAMTWFRPGSLTDAIRKQLGLDDPIRID